ncbi:hypothetical protein HPB50_003463 [Hyalomma asiaticum]|uniref:Uncharacterized protein n=1 Tax=Hyalomma asiaticum TaxID=266040 RepID=A0ACB7RY79_HYAAI|nr:hypothetical protein HPB50_003463 [Hyalomma asiaticum]
MFPVADTTARGPGPTQTPAPSTALNETLPSETVTPENPPSTDQVAEDNTQLHHSPLPTTSSPAEAPQQVLRECTDIAHDAAGDAVAVAETADRCRKLRRWRTTRGHLLGSAFVIQ